MGSAHRQWLLHVVPDGRVAPPEGFLIFVFSCISRISTSLRAHSITRIAYVPAVKIVHHGGHAARKGLRHIGLFARLALTFFRLHAGNGTDELFRRSRAWLRGAALCWPLPGLPVCCCRARGAAAAAGRSPARRCRRNPLLGQRETRWCPRRLGCATRCAFAAAGRTRQFASPVCRQSPSTESCGSAVVASTNCPASGAAKQARDEDWRRVKYMIFEQPGWCGQLRAHRTHPHRGQCRCAMAAGRRAVPRGGSARAAGEA